MLLRVEHHCTYLLYCCIMYRQKMMKVGLMWTTFLFPAWCKPRRFGLIVLHINLKFHILSNWVHHKSSLYHYPSLSIIWYYYTNSCFHFQPTMCPNTFVHVLQVIVLLSMWPLSLFKCPPTHTAPTAFGMNAVLNEHLTMRRDIHLTHTTVGATVLLFLDIPFSTVLLLLF